MFKTWGNKMALNINININAESAYGITIISFFGFLVSLILWG
jgi:hypothetical protein